MTAHKIGVELAKRMWGERFEVMVSTHMNTGTVHNHFCLNSVSFADGKKYYSGKALNRKLRRCRTRSVGNTGCRSLRIPQGRPIGRLETGTARGKRSVHLAVADQKDMDEAIARNTVWRYFADDLKAGDIHWNGEESISASDRTARANSSVWIVSERATPWKMCGQDWRKNWSKAPPIFSAVPQTDARKAERTLCTLSALLLPSR